LESKKGFFPLFAKEATLFASSTQGLCPTEAKQFLDGRPPGKDLVVAGKGVSEASRGAQF